MIVSNKFILKVLYHTKIILKIILYDSDHNGDDVINNKANKNTNIVTE